MYKKYGKLDGKMARLEMFAAMAVSKKIYFNKKLENQSQKRELTPLHIGVKMIARLSSLALMSSDHGKNRVISGRRHRVIGEKLPMELAPRDDISKKIYLGKSFKISGRTPLSTSN